MSFMFVLPDHVKGLIFDFDGTLVNTMPNHYLAWRDTIQAHGGDLSEELFYSTTGMPSNQIVILLNEKFGYRLDPEKVAHDKEQLFLDKYSSTIQLIEPVVEIARRYHGQLPMAVATGGIRKVVGMLITQLELMPLFDALVTSDDVVNGKPAPDTFLLAAQQINLPPEQCHVFEDGDLGLQGAKLAGMSSSDVRGWY